MIQFMFKGKTTSVFSILLRLKLAFQIFWLNLLIAETHFKKSARQVFVLIMEAVLIILEIEVIYCNDSTSKKFEFLIN